MRSFGHSRMAPNLALRRRFLCAAFAAALLALTGPSAYAAQSEEQDPSQFFADPLILGVGNGIGLKVVSLQWDTFRWTIADMGLGLLPQHWFIYAGSTVQWRLTSSDQVDLWFVTGLWWGDSLVTGSSLWGGARSVGFWAPLGLECSDRFGQGVAIWGVRAIYAPLLLGVRERVGGLFGAPGSWSGGGTGGLTGLALIQIFVGF